jgi:hypothetical protein
LCCSQNGSFIWSGEEAARVTIFGIRISAGAPQQTHNGGNTR